MKSILYITVHHMDPVHPRIDKEMETLRALNCAVDFLSLKDVEQENSKSTRVFRSLFFNPLFNRDALALLDEKLDYDVYVFYDMHLLKLACLFKDKYSNKKVVYETIDDNCSLFLYFHFRKLGKYYLDIEPWLKVPLDAMELYCARKIDDVVVNSKALKDKFGYRAHLLFYTSIFPMPLVQDISLPPALLYLGYFDSDKGAEESLHLAARLGVDIHIFGNVGPADVSMVQNYKRAYLYGHLDEKAMYGHLVSLAQSNFLFGLSLIKKVHYSYMTQIANKEIDYIALRIPIIGNYREPTKDLIDRGAGLYADDPSLIDKLSSRETRSLMIDNLAQLHCTNFSHEIFKNKLFDIFH